MSPYVESVDVSYRASHTIKFKFQYKSISFYECSDILSLQLITKAPYSIAVAPL